MEEIKYMKTSNFYAEHQRLEAREITEIKKAIKAHGGEFSWFNEDDEELDYSYPIVIAETDGYVGNVIIRKIWIDECDFLCFDAVDCEYGYEVSIDMSNINNLYCILDYIPATDKIDNVTSCPLNEGQKVFWCDPEESISSGIYTVVCVSEVFEEDSIILISNDFSEVEVTIDELWIPAIKK